MPHEIVHTIGSTIYGVFANLFLWMSRIPRTNPGAIWWAGGMLFALASRLVFVALLISGQDTLLTSAAYSVLNVVEKLFLVCGLVRFFNLPIRVSWFCVATIAIEIWILATWGAGASPILRSFGVALFNAGFLSFAAWVAFTKCDEFHPKLMSVTGLTSAVLAVHWLSAFVLIQMFPNWLINGFLLGTVLALIQYLSLLAALLLSFQQRLLTAEAKALDMAFQDPLTGLSNQRYVDTLFEKVLVLATRPHQLVAVIYIDLDNFKPINDRAGHRVGDEVLRVIAARLRQATRSTDICARIGGDEFVTICTQIEDQAQVEVIAEKLLSEITDSISIDGKDYVLGASIGISLYPLHGSSLPELLGYADAAMYQVKRDGKNGYRIHASKPATAQATG